MFQKKIFLKKHDYSLYPHRSGWVYAVDYIRKLHSKNGVIFESFIEKKFVWGNDFGDMNNHPTPYLEPWVGVFHIPDNIPEWFDSKQTPKEIFKNKYFIESLKYCKGFYCLSNYEKEILKQYTNIPINVLYHPTEMPKVKFDFEKFIENENKEIIQLGIFLRKISSIFLLKTTKYKKSALGITWKNLIQLKKESESLNIKLNFNDVKIYKFLNNNKYDEILSKNIAFVDLYNASANNAVIECIVRNTPLLIKSHPAIKEYLGDDYPFYFNTLEEACEKAEDIELIKKTTVYLENLKIKERLTGDAFVESIYNSDIYKNLEVENIKVLKLLGRYLNELIIFIFININKIKRSIIKIIHHYDHP
jgi:hypothetical protein